MLFSWSLPFFSLRRRQSQQPVYWGLCESSGCDTGCCFSGSSFRRKKKASATFPELLTAYKT